MMNTALDSSRKTLSAWIWEELADIEFGSVYTPFGGNSRVAQWFKRKGYQTFVTEILQNHYWKAVALVQNNDAILTPNHFKTMTGSGAMDNHSDFDLWQDHYFTKEETQLLSQWWNNIENGADFQNSPELKGMAYTAVYLTMHYWLGFNQRALQPKPMNSNDALLHYIQQLNNWVSNNDKPNMAYFSDAYDMAAQLPAHVTYLNPPAMSGFRDTNLKTELAECWTRRVTQINLSGVISQDQGPRLGQNFEDSNSYLQALGNFIDLCEGSRTLVFHHSDNLGVELGAIESLIEQKRQIWKRSVMEIPYPYAEETLIDKETLIIAVSE